jgi:hypothetical protein
MGVEQLRDGAITMLVLDPSHSPAQMAHFNTTSSAPGAMRLVRKSTAAMKARQYQVVAVTSTMDTEAQYQVTRALPQSWAPSSCCLLINSRNLTVSRISFVFCLQQSKVLRSMRVPQDR